MGGLFYECFTFGVARSLLELMEDYLYVEDMNTDLFLRGN